MRLLKKTTAFILSLFTVFVFCSCENANTFLPDSSDVSQWANSSTLEQESSNKSESVVESSDYASDINTQLEKPSSSFDKSSLNSIDKSNSSNIDKTSSKSVTSAQALLANNFVKAVGVLNDKTQSTDTRSQLVTDFFDVGQGDSEFVILPDGKTLLIDAGNDGDGTKIVAFLKKCGITRIDYLVATHPHADHIGGMDEIINSMEIGKIFAPKIADSNIPTTIVYKNFLTAVSKKSLKITSPAAGAVMFSGTDYSAICYGPCGTKYTDLNNYSIVFKLTYKKISFLFTGDAEALSEKEIISRQYDLKSTVLKVGHHGSRYSCTSAFIKSVAPEYAVISCGKKNTYGHPAAQTVSALKAISGMKQVFRTDNDKSVLCVTDGITVTAIKSGIQGPLK